ncbi:MAG: hypothetical protein HOO15_04155, partial [Flavobacteriales bacterium]|nr:hypothetical protein [Flavobacteriales bacterium]
MRKYIFILLFAPFFSFSQTQECATVPTQSQIDYLTQTRSARENWDGPEMIISLPVQHHIVRETNGTGGLDPNDIPIIMGIMNTYYANANISFFDCGTINYIDNSSYYNFNQSQESSVCGANDVTDVINIYYFNSVSSGSSSLCGYAYFPGGSWKNRIIMNNSCALNGSTLTHELGHYLSLYHTHQGSTGSNPELVNGTNCTTAGDQLCDTPADPTLSTSTVNSSCQYTGTSTDPNGQTYVPDPTNIMSYSRKSCRTFLSAGQYNRANYSAINDRGYLNCNTVVYGCTDPNAINYNPLATVDDGSCSYCVTTLPYSEDFNNGIGSWTNTGSAGNWILNSAGTPSNNTGPTSGNSGSGNYMYIESSSPNYPSVGPFTLTSECFDLSNSTNPSLSFYYNMYGAAIGTLNVYANSSLIWSLSGNQGQGWNLVQIPLTSVGNTLIIEFEGTTGSSWTSDIAIDDINIIGIQQVNGCTDPNAINYNPNATVDDGSCIYPIVVSVTGNNLSCNGANDGSCSVAVSGGQTPYTYLWNTGQTTSSINNLSAGTYTVTVTDDSGQTQTTSYTITEPSAITIIYSVTNVSFAGGNDGAINITPSGGVTPYLYYWNTNPTQTTQSINNLIAGTYTVWVVDANGCIGTVLITINENISTTCGAITGVNLTDVIHDRATFNWDNMNSSICDVDQIRFRYREVGTNSYSTKTMGVPTGSGCNTSNTSKLVLGLSPSTTYEYDFKIWYCNASAVNWHAGGTFTTLPLCDNVINVVPTPITTTKTQFCWDSVSTYAFVRLQYRENVPGSSFSNIGGMGVFSPILCKEKNGLTPGLSYRVMWRTWCNPSGGPYRSPQWDGPVIWTQPNSIRVDKLSSINSLEVYPNPSRDVFNVEFTSETKQSIEVRIVNLVGQVVFTDNLEDFDGEYTHSFNLSEYSKG